MRTATWEKEPGALVQLLNGLSATTLYMADLWTLSRDGQVIARWTGADSDVYVADHLYKRDPLISRETIKFVVGIEVSALSVELSPAQEGTLINSVPLLRFAAQKGFDNCRLRLERAFAQSPDSEFIGVLSMFDGRISSPTVTRGRVQIEVKSDLELLDAQVPANVYQPACMNTCYDAACGLKRVEYKTTVLSPSNDKRTTFGIKYPQAANDFFALGSVTFLSGANKGVSRSIRSSTESTITLMAALPADAELDDQVVFVRGCNRTKAMCKTLGNFKNFRGCPYIPIPETII